MNESNMILNPYIKLTDSSLFILIPVSYEKVCSEPCSKPAQTCCMCCLLERHEALVKTDSVTNLKNISKLIIKTLE